MFMSTPAAGSVSDVPTDVEIAFWIGALVITIIVTIVVLAIKCKDSKGYVESWIDDDKY